MRLIDADVLIEEIKSLEVIVTGLRVGKGILHEYAKNYKESVLRTIDEQPTAYDVEKVVEEIKEAECASGALERKCWLDKVIDSVRKGVVE